MDNLKEYSIFINESEEVKQKYYIYTLSDPTTGEVKYVGKTKDTKDRIRRHMSNDHLRDAWTSKNKWLLWLKNQGLKPDIEILDEGDADNINSLEIYWISQLKQWGYKLKNETEGGDGGRNWLGKKHKESSKLKCKMNSPTRRPICKYEIGTDKLLGEYESSHDVQREDPNIKRGHVSRCCNGVENYNSVGGYYWRYKDNYFPYEAPSNKPIKIEQYNYNDELVKIYRSTYELRKSGFNYRVIRKHNNEHYGFYWKFI